MGIVASVLGRSFSASQAIAQAVVQQPAARPQYEPVKVSIPCSIPHASRHVSLTRDGAIEVEDCDFGYESWGGEDDGYTATYRVAANDVATIAQALTNQLGVAVSIPEVPQRLVSAARSMKDILDRIRQMGVTIPAPTYE